MPKYHLSKGSPIAQPAKKTVKPIKGKRGPLDQRSKRVRSERHTPEGQTDKKNARQDKGSCAPITKAPRPLKPNFSQTAGGTQVGIIPNNYQNELLTVKETKGTQ